MTRAREFLRPYENLQKVTQTFLSDYLGMMPTRFRYVKDFFVHLLFRSVFLVFCSSFQSDKGVSKMRVF